MSEIKAHHDVIVGTEKSFAIVFAVVFAITGFWPLLAGQSVRLWALVVAIIILALGFLFPQALRPLNILWFKLGLLLGRIIAPIVIAILFFVAITPTGIIVRLMRKDPLRLKIDPAAKSYWIRRSKDENPMGTMKNQF